MTTYLAIPAGDLDAVPADWIPPRLKRAFEDRGVPRHPDLITIAGWRFDDAHRDWCFGFYFISRFAADAALFDAAIYAAEEISAGLDELQASEAGT